MSVPAFTVAAGQHPPPGAVHIGGGVYVQGVIPQAPATVPAAAQSVASADGGAAAAAAASGAGVAPTIPSGANASKPGVVGGAKGGKKGGNGSAGNARSFKPDTDESEKASEDYEEAEPRDEGPGPGWTNRGGVGSFVKFERTIQRANGKTRIEYMLVARKGAPASLEARYNRSRRADIGVPNILEAQHIAKLRHDVTWIFFQEGTNHAPADAARLQATLLAQEQMVRHDRAVTVLDVGGSIGTWTKTHAPLGLAAGNLSVHVITDETVTSSSGVGLNVARTGMVTTCRFDCENAACKCKKTQDYVFMRDVDWYPAVVDKALALSSPRLGYRVVTTYALPYMFHNVKGKPTLRNNFDTPGVVKCTTDGASSAGTTVTYTNDDTRAWLEDCKRQWVGPDGEEHTLYFDLLATAGPPDDEREQMKVLAMTVDVPNRPNQRVARAPATTRVIDADPALGITGGTLTAPTAALKTVEGAAYAGGSGGRLHMGKARAAGYQAAVELQARGELTIEEAEASVEMAVDRLDRARAATSGVAVQREADVGLARTALQEPARAVEGSIRLRYRRAYVQAEAAFRSCSGLQLVYPFFILCVAALVLGVPSGRKCYLPSGRHILASVVSFVALTYFTVLVERARNNFGWIIPAAVALVEMLTHTLSGLDLGDDHPPHERVHLGGPMLAAIEAWLCWWAPETFTGSAPLNDPGFKLGHGWLLFWHVGYNWQCWVTLMAVLVRGFRYHDAWWPSDPMGRAFAAAITNWGNTQLWLRRMAAPTFRVLRVEGGLRIPPRPGKAAPPVQRRTAFTRYTPVSKEYSVGVPAIVVGFVFLAMMPGMVMSDVNAMVAHRMQVEHNEPPLPTYTHSPCGLHFELPPVPAEPVDELELDTKQAKVFDEPDDQQRKAYEGSCKVEHTMKAEGEGVARLVVAVARSARDGVISAARALHGSLTAASKATLEGGNNLVYGHGLNPVEVAAAHALCSDAEFVVETDGKAYDDHEKVAAAVTQNNAHQHVSGVQPVPMDPVTIALPGGAKLEHTGPVRVSGRDDTGCGNAVTNLEGQVHALVSGVFGAARHVTKVSSTLIAQAAESVGATLNQGAGSALTMAQFAQLSLTTSGAKLLKRLKANVHWAAGDDGLVVVRLLGLLTKVGRDEFYGAVVAAWHFRGHPVTGGLVSWQMATFCSQRFYPCEPFVYTNHAMSIRVNNFPGPLVARALYKLTASFLSAKVPALRGMMANDAKARLRGAAHVPFVRVALQWMVTAWGKHDRGVGLPNSYEVFGEIPDDFVVVAPQGVAGDVRTWDFFAAVYGDEYPWEEIEATFQFQLMDFDPDAHEVGVFDVDWMEQLAKVDKGSPEHPTWCP